MDYQIGCDILWLINLMYSTAVSWSASNAIVDHVDNMIVVAINQVCLVVFVAGPYSFRHDAISHVGEPSDGHNEKLKHCLGSPRSTQRYVRML